MEVSAIVVTRGDVDLRPIYDSIPLGWEIVWWNNGDGTVTITHRDREYYCDVRESGLPDLGVYGRYAAIEYASHPIIFIQDDDCVIRDPSRIVATYEPGIVSFNMPYSFRDGGVDSEMVGFGSCFHRDLPTRTFDHFYEMGFEFTWPLFHRTCDVVFTSLTPTKMVHEPLELLDYSYADNRMWRQPNHNIERRQMRDLCEEISRRASSGS
jgi:hypothetical protein